MSVGTLKLRVVLRRPTQDIGAIEAAARRVQSAIDTPQPELDRMAREIRELAKRT